MKYLSDKPFSVPPAKVSQAEWDRIFGKKPKKKSK
jgi:hypothetical protein